MVSLGCMAMEKLTYSQKLDIVNILIAGKAKPMSLLQRLSSQARQKLIKIKTSITKLLYHSHDLYML